MKNNFYEIYALYLVALFGTMFSPTFISTAIQDFGSLPFTMAFSNVPGLSRPIYFKDSASISMQYYVIPAGGCGMSICCLSYCDYVKITCLSDTSIMENPKELMDLLENNIRSCIKLHEPNDVTDSSMYESTSATL